MADGLLSKTIDLLICPQMTDTFFLSTCSFFFFGRVRHRLLGTVQRPGRGHRLLPLPRAPSTHLHPHLLPAQVVAPQEAWLRRLSCRRLAEHCHPADGRLSSAFFLFSEELLHGGAAHQRKDVPKEVQQGRTRSAGHSAGEEFPCERRWLCLLDAKGRKRRSCCIAEPRPQSRDDSTSAAPTAPTTSAAAVPPEPCLSQPAATARPLSGVSTKQRKCRRRRRGPLCLQSQQQQQPQWRGRGQGE